MLKPAPRRERRLPSALSPSSIELYHQCPRKFEIQKINGGREPAGRDALRGTLIHRILELLMQRDPEGRTREAARDCAKEAWPETVENPDFIALGLSDDDQREFKWSAWESVENYFHMEKPTEVVVEATEQKVSGTIGGVPLLGIIDRLDREGDDLIVSDYKGGKVPDPKYRQSKWDQLNLYGALVGATTGTTPTVGRLLFTTHSQILETPFTEDSLGAVVEMAAEVWGEVQKDFKANSFSPKVGPLCGWCLYANTCPEGMAHLTSLYRKGRLKESAPAYTLVADPMRR